MALDPSLLRRFPSDGLLFNPQNIAQSEALHLVLNLFEREGLAREYRIAMMLCSSSLNPPWLQRILCHVEPAILSDEEVNELELFVEAGHWGYRTNKQVHILPIYDEGFDFSDSLAAVRLGKSWFYINHSGDKIIDASQYDAVKPFCEGRGRGRRSNIWYSFNTAGRDIRIHVK